jgi:hypothetical protein
MRNFLIVMVTTMCMGISLASVVRAQDFDWRGQRKQLKAQQKVERIALKRQQQSAMRSWKTFAVSKAARTQAKHQMQRDRRNLHQRQKDALQDLKDRQRIFKETSKAYGH